MDRLTAHSLRQLNNDFYAHNASSFASTRNNSWRGWERCLQTADADFPNALSVLDVACGTMRFNRWLRSRLPEADVRYRGIDSCADLAPEELGTGVSFRCVDVLQLLFDRVWPERDRGASSSCDTHELLMCSGVDDDWLLRNSGAVPFDVVTCFGFMHHVPGEEARALLLRALVACAEAGGLVAVSFWQFMNSAELACRAHETTEIGLCQIGMRNGNDSGLLRAVPFEGGFCSLDDNDYLLGWNGSTKHLRYCHHFDSSEVDRLVHAVSDVADVEDRFDCDGRTGNLNGYLVLRRKGN